MVDRGVSHFRHVVDVWAIMLTTYLDTFLINAMRDTNKQTAIH